MLSLIQGPRPSLTDPFLKTERAKTHLDDLLGEVDAWSNSQPWSLNRNDNISAGIYRLEIDYKDVPAKIYLILGDLLYCLRASLDQLVYQLASLTTSQPEKTQFPIFDTFSPKKFKKCTNGIPARAAEIIDAFQPYNLGGKSNLLWKLNELGNLDKHRRIPLFGKASTINFPDAPESIHELIKFAEEGGVFVVTAPLFCQGFLTHVEVRDYKVVFGHLDKIECDVDQIKQIYHFVTERVIPSFVPLFEDYPATNSHNTP